MCVRHGVMLKGRMIMYSRELCNVQTVANECAIEMDTCGAQN